jgi:hypothetical protein
MDYLNKFYVDKTMRDVVKEFLLQCLRDTAVMKSFQGDSTSGIMEARLNIESAFNKLEEMFEPKKETININQAK